MTGKIWRMPCVREGEGAMPSVGRWERDRERRKNKMKFDTLFLFVGAKQKRFANVCWHLYWCFVGYEINTRAHTHTQTSGCLLLPVDFPIILRVFYSECQDQHERPWSGWPYHPLGALCPQTNRLRHLQDPSGLRPTHPFSTCTSTISLWARANLSKYRKLVYPEKFAIFPLQKFFEFITSLFNRTYFSQTIERTGPKFEEI